MIEKNIKKLSNPSYLLIYKIQKESLKICTTWSFSLLVDDPGLNKVCVSPSRQVLFLFLFL